MEEIEQIENKVDKLRKKMENMDDTNPEREEILIKLLKLQRKELDLLKKEHDKISG